MGKDPDARGGGSESGLLRDQAESWSGTSRRSYQSRGTKQGQNRENTGKGSNWEIQ